MTSPKFDLAAARAVVTAATQPGPWTVREDFRGVERSCMVIDRDGMWVADCGNDDENSAFIAAARSLVPRLIEEVERLEHRWRTRLTVEGEAHMKALVQRYSDADREEQLAQQAVTHARNADLLAQCMDAALDRIEALEKALAEACNALDSYAVLSVPANLGPTHSATAQRLRALLAKCSCKAGDACSECPDSPILPAKETP